VTTAEDGATRYRPPRLFEKAQNAGRNRPPLLGSPGLQIARTRYEAAAHQYAVAMLRERLSDSRFASALSTLERADIELFAADHLDFVSCIARRELERTRQL
jgi:hypothetical protein